MSKIPCIGTIVRHAIAPILHLYLLSCAGDDCLKLKLKAEETAGIVKHHSSLFQGLLRSCLEELGSGQCSQMGSKKVLQELCVFCERASCVDYWKSNAAE